MRSSPHGASLFLSCLGLSPLLAQTFEPAVVHSVSALVGAPADSVLADVDRDGSADLVSLGSGNVLVLRSVASATPPPALLLPLTNTFFATTLQVVDGDGDGLLDVWVGFAFGILSFRGDGNGGFAAPERIPAFGAAFRIADLDGDGLPDRVQNGATGLAIARGLGGGVFAAPAPVPSPDAQYAWIGVDDVDGDRDLDVVGLVGFGGMVRVYLADGAGGLAPVDPTFAVGGLLLGRALLADFDADGRSDLVSFGMAPELRLAVGGGAYGPARSLVSSVASGSACDLDGDGDLDLARPVTNGLRIDRGDGAGSFPSAVEVSGPGANGTVCSGDVDGDGDVDLVAIGTSFVRVLRVASPLPNGTAAFGSGTPSCAGTLGLAATTSPTIGQSAFALRTTNASPRTMGILALGTPVTAGWDPLGIGLQLHLGRALPVGTATADAGGTARFALSIPNRPLLAGLRITAQAVWFEDAANGLACSTAEYAIASSRGLTLTLLR